MLLQYVYHYCNIYSHYYFFKNVYLRKKFPILVVLTRAVYGGKRFLNCCDYHKLFYTSQLCEPEKILTKLEVGFYSRAKIQTFITHWLTSGIVLLTIDFLNFP